MHTRFNEERKFFISVREVLTDNKLGKSKSFSVYKSKKELSLDEMTELLQKSINKTKIKND